MAYTFLCLGLSFRLGALVNMSFAAWNAQARLMSSILFVCVACFLLRRARFNPKKTTIVTKWRWLPLIIAYGWSLFCFSVPLAWKRGTHFFCVVPIAGFTSHSVPTSGFSTKWFVFNSVLFLRRA